MVLVLDTIKDKVHGYVSQLQSRNLKLHRKAFDLLTLDLSPEAMLQGGKVLGTHLAQ